MLPSESEQSYKTIVSTIRMLYKYDFNLLNRSNVTRTLTEYT